MISVFSALLCVAFVLPLIPGSYSNQLYLQPAKKQVGYFTDDNFFITCYTTEETIDNLSWQDSDGETITAAEGRIHIQPTVGAQKGLELVVEQVQREDGGQYTCGDMQSTVSFELIVYSSISFGETSKVQHAPDGGDAFIKCNAKAEPKPGVSWYFKTKKIVNSDKYNQDEEGLTIKSVTREDAGNYKCKAFIITHLGAQVKEMDIEFQVQYAPEWLNENESAVYASYGSDANITCSASSNPEPLFQWMRDGERIHNSSDHMIISNVNQTMLRFKINSEDQYGEYLCSVSNTRGQREKLIQLKEGTAPQPPTLKVVSEDQGTMRLGIKENGKNELNVTAFRVQFKLATETWDQATTQDFNKGEAYVLRNMSYNSKYQLHAAARNPVGHSNYSDLIEYTTHRFQVAQVVSDNGAGVTLSLSLFVFILNAIVFYLN